MTDAGNRLAFETRVIHAGQEPDPLTGAVERRDALRRELQTPLDAVVIVQVARLEPYKGHGLLIDAHLIWELEHD